MKFFLGMLSGAFLLVIIGWLAAPQGMALIALFIMCSVGRCN